ncbi:MAG: SpoIID/LytB domain-containing protein [Bacteroidales bacterium]|jgi:SpoIID/LytB domain protein|nr:SpoIID/LytB domain-containing protein [Bacteroidales bacterium]
MKHVQIGIFTAAEIIFLFNDMYVADGVAIIPEQRYAARLSAGKIEFQGRQFDSLLFESSNPQATFCLQDVPIGISFHWERKTNPCFQGNLRIIVDDGKLIAINVVHVEDYLASVISSEMSATASLEFLKAHAVISRSWLLAQIEKNRSLTNEKKTYCTSMQTEEEYVRWYDREDHRLFDVCADDHCQRYQGISRIVSSVALQAVKETCGEILVYNGAICDARFSKCCGGATEEFQHVWEPVMHPYLNTVYDGDDAISLPDLSVEENAETWIRSSIPAFCNTAAERILSQVLNDYDRETTHFYRWQVNYSQSELATLIAQNTELELGAIIDLIPVERGKSGRLTKLKIIGTKRAITLGKELEIRCILSPSHLYSSAFVVDKANCINGVPQSFTITGAGWGHGVGLCQIGAAIMGENGYSYRDILLHYFSGAEIVSNNSLHRER